MAILVVNHFYFIILEPLDCKKNVIINMPIFQYD